MPAGTTPVTLHVNGDGGVAGCAIIDTCATQVTVNDIEVSNQCMESESYQQLKQSNIPSFSLAESYD